MIIQCPSCKARYELERRPPKMFHCRKCSYTAPFREILHPAQEDPQPDTLPTHTDDPYTPSAQAASETKVVQSLQGDPTKVVAGLSGDGKTIVVQSLQPPRKAVLQVFFNGKPFSTVPVPFGSCSLGRRSSDSKAKVQITPDMSMSRLHASMRLTKVDGQFVYQITSAKDSNPVYVNNKPIAKGKACNLKSGDMIKMGCTIMVFRLV